MRLQCKSPGCTFFEHTGRKKFKGFCCTRCSRKAGDHGKLCESEEFSKSCWPQSTSCEQRRHQAIDAVGAEIPRALEVPREQSRGRAIICLRPSGLFCATVKDNVEWLSCAKSLRQEALYSIKGIVYTEQWKATEAMKRVLPEVEASFPQQQFATLVEVCEGPLEGLTAVGVGDRKGEREKASDLALVYTVAVKNQMPERSPDMAKFLESIGYKDSLAATSGTVSPNADRRVSPLESAVTQAAAPKRRKLSSATKAREAAARARGAAAAEDNARPVEEGYDDRRDPAEAETRHRFEEIIADIESEDRKNEARQLQSYVPEHQDPVDEEQSVEQDEDEALITQSPAHDYQDPVEEGEEEVEPEEDKADYNAGPRRLVPRCKYAAQPRNVEDVRESRSTTEDMLRRENAELQRKLEEAHQRQEEAQQLQIQNQWDMIKSLLSGHSGSQPQAAAAPEQLALPDLELPACGPCPPTSRPPPHLLVEQLPEHPFEDDMIDIDEFVDEDALMIKGNDDNADDASWTVYGELETLPVDAISYTQKSISRKFYRPDVPHEEKYVESLIQALVDERYQPLREPWLTLSVVRIMEDQKVHSIDNRRLYALKQAQARIRASAFCWMSFNVLARVRVVGTFNSLKLAKQFVRHFDTTSQGQDVLVRHSFK